MVDDNQDTQATDDSSDSGLDSGMNLSFDQLMRLVKETSAVAPNASTNPPPLPSPYNAPQVSKPQPMQAQQPMPRPAPPMQQAPQQPQQPVAANVPQAGKVLDQASGAYIRPDTAKNLDWFRNTGKQLDQQKQTQDQQQANQPQNTWQQIYAALRQQNPQASPQQLLTSMKAYKDSGAFETYAKNAVGKTVEEQVYNSLIKTGMSAEDAAKQVQNLRGISPEKAGEKAAAVETQKKQADTIINKPKAEEKLDDMNNSMDNTIKFIEMAKKQVSPMTTGPGALLSSIPGTPAKDLASTVSTIKANIGFDKLQTMKDESPTGSALGRVTNMEIGLLQNVVANLDTEQSQDQFLLHLDIAKEEVEKAKKRIADAYDMTYGSGGFQAAESILGGGGSKPNSAPAAPASQPKVINYSDWK